MEHDFSKGLTGAEKAAKAAAAEAEKLAKEAAPDVKWAAGEAWKGATWCAQDATCKAEVKKYGTKAVELALKKKAALQELYGSSHSYMQNLFVPYANCPKADYAGHYESGCGDYLIVML